MRLIEAPTTADNLHLSENCARLFACDVADVRGIHAPYRLCPLGAHIDHQLGPVSAFATPHGIRLAFVPRQDSTVLIQSRGYEGQVRLDLADAQQRAGDWADYARGAIKVLSEIAPVNYGFSMLIDGQLSEAGLSSSAAVGLGYLAALCDANEITLSPRALVDLDRQIENDFMSLNNGVLDPAAIAFSVPDQLTLINCRTVEFETIPQQVPFRFIAVYSGVREGLVNSPKFNNRVTECFEAGRKLRTLLGERQAAPQPLGNTSFSDWEQVKSKLEGTCARRATHFFTESARVMAGAEAWRNSDEETFGRLMTESACSSINNYETGSPQLIGLFESLSETTGVFGARFCGAGFRGACVALVNERDFESIVADALTGYLREFPQYAGDVWAIEAKPSSGLTRL